MILEDECCLILDIDRVIVMPEFRRSNKRDPRAAPTANHLYRPHLSTLFRLQILAYALLYFAKGGLIVITIAVNFSEFHRAHGEMASHCTSVDHSAGQAFGSRAFSGSELFEIILVSIHIIYSRRL